MKRIMYRGTIRYYRKINYINILLIIIFVIGIFFIIFGMNFIKKEISIYSYTIEKNDDYRVTLKPNIFYESNILTSGRILCFSIN